MATCASAGLVVGTGAGRALVARGRTSSGWRSMTQPAAPPPTTKASSTASMITPQPHRRGGSGNGNVPRQSWPWSRKARQFADWGGFWHSCTGQRGIIGARRGVERGPALPAAALTRGPMVASAMVPGRGRRGRPRRRNGDAASAEWRRTSAPAASISGERGGRKRVMDDGRPRAR